MAGCQAGDVDLFECWDAYSIYGVLSLEAAGFAARGEGWKMAQPNQIGRDGLLPVATFGGLKARGNPGGATGVYQAVEATLQLRGEAGDNQLTCAERAMIQCLGGPASSAVAHILEVAQ
jgi:acetyl-CoA C-acetyltransferase